MSNRDDEKRGESFHRFKDEDLNMCSVGAATFTATSSGFMRIVVGGKRSGVATYINSSETQDLIDFLLSWRAYQEKKDKEHETKTTAL